MNSLLKVARLLLILFLLLSVIAPARPVTAQSLQPPYRLSEMSPMSLGSGPRDFVDLNGTVFFNAYEDPKFSDSHYSTWKSDGTPEGTQKVLPGVTMGNASYASADYVYFNSSAGDFRRINGEPGVSELVLNGTVGYGAVNEMGGALYFLGNTFDPNFEEETYSLYKIDRSQAGAQIVQSWSHFNASFSPFGSLLAVLGNRLFFNCPTENGSELCVSDGTPEGTGIFTQIGAPGKTYAEFFTVFKGNLYFRARTDAAGSELWVTGGSPETTHLVVDLASGVDSSFPDNLTASGDYLYFTAQTRSAGPTSSFETGLWKTDGSQAGTARVKDKLGLLTTAKYFDRLTVAGSVLFFVVDGNTLWRTDGTAEGTFSLTSIGDNYEIGHQLAAFKDKLYFDSDYDGRSLWVSDGSLAGTAEFKNIDPGEIIATEDLLFFNGDDGFNGAELWVSDGTSQGTHLVKNINAALTVRPPKAIIPAGDRVFMISDDSLEDPDYPGSPNHPRYQLWISDGTPGGTRLAPNPAACSEVYFNPQFHAVVDGVLYYPGGDCNIWRTDGTAEGTWRVPGSWNLDFNNAYGTTTFGEQVLLFEGYGGVTNLWAVEGDPASVHMVKTVGSSTEYASVYWETVYKNAFYFLTYTRHDYSLSGSPRGWWKLWKSDGTEAGTQVVCEVDLQELPLPDYINPSPVVKANNLLFFTIWHPQDGYILYQSDGTRAGTRPVAAQPAGLTTLPLAEVGGYLYASHSVSEYAGYGGGSSNYRYKTELYKTNGDARGLQLIYRFPDLMDSYSDEIVEPVNMGGKLYFAFRYHLWVSDGTSAGTHVVGSAGEEGVTPRNLTVMRGRLFYSAYDDRETELWSSDGPPQGTAQIADLRTGQYLSENGSYPGNLTPLGGRLFFSANDGVHGIQLWVYDFLMHSLYLPLARK